MKKYTLYFELFGKKMKTDIYADDKTHAMQKLRNSINVLKVSEPDSELDFLRDIFKMR